MKQQGDSFPAELLFLTLSNEWTFPKHTPLAEQIPTVIMELKTPKPLEQKARSREVTTLVVSLTPQSCYETLGEKHPQLLGAAVMMHN